MQKFIFQLIMFCLFSVATYAQSASYVLSAASGGTGYQWYKDGTAISGATSATYTATATGSYYATFNNGTCATSTPTTVLATSGSSVTFNASSTSGTAYQWKSGASGSSSNISGATSATYSTSTAGIYSVAVTTSSCTAGSTDYYLYYLSASGNCAAGNTPPSVN